MNERVRDYERYRAEGWWRDDRLTDDVRRWASTQGDRVAVIDEHRRITWSELWNEARATAAVLQRLGVGAGDIVSSQLPNGADVVVLHVAVELVGGVHNPLAVQFREHEIDQVYGLLDSRLVLHPGTWRDVDYAAIQGATQASNDGRVVAASDVLIGGAGGRGAVDGAPETSPSKATEGAYILNTSGTVAMKGVLHSHEEAQYSARTVAEIVALAPDDVVMCAVPMSWGAGLCWGVRFALFAGATLVSMERWDPRAAANLIDTEGGTFIYGPPTMARDLVDLADEWHPAGPLKMICAGAPIPRQMCVDARMRLGLALIPGYGQTEHLHSALGRLDDPLEKLTGSDGRALPGVLLRAVDDHGNECASGEPGELECRGPNVALGYFNQPDLTNETFRPDGWQTTQDLGTFDDDGYLRIAGRKRDIIIRGGLNVSPREVEELLLRLPDVKDAAVVGYPDARYGERICAFIVPTGKAPPTVEEITAALGEMGVAKYKHPERIEQIDELPLTTTGKVRHQALRDRMVVATRDS
jgi:acyl-CoA synthetase (AMP-forming)/AMP-acid ligase II